MSPSRELRTLSAFVTTEEELEEVLGRPSSLVLAKVVGRLDDICLAFIARSPFVVIASHDAEGPRRRVAER